MRVFNACIHVCMYVCMYGMQACMYAMMVYPHASIHICMSVCMCNAFNVCHATLCAVALCDVVRYGVV